MIRKFILASIAFLFAVTTFLAMPANAADNFHQDTVAQYSQQDQKAKGQNNQEKQYTQTEQRSQEDQVSGKQNQQEQQYKQTSQRFQEDQSFQNQSSQAWQQQQQQPNNDEAV